MTNGLIKRAALYIGILAFALVLLLLLGAGQASAEEVTDDITVDTTWVSGGVYNISADITVIDGVTLEIEKDATVIFNGSYYLIVEGTMYVNGTAEEPVVFTNNASLGLGGGIEYENGSSGSISYASISHVMYGISIRNATVPCSNLLINDTSYALYYEFFGAEQEAVLTLADITITNASTALYANNDNGTLDISMVRFHTDVTTRVASLAALGANDTGAVSLRVHDSVLRSTRDGIWIDAKTVGLVEVLDSELIVEYGSYYYFILGSNYDSEGDMSIILDNVMFDAVGGALFAQTVGNITASINEVNVHNMFVFSYLKGTNVDLSVTNTNFVNSSGGFWINAAEGANVEIIDSSFVNDPSYFTPSILTAPLRVEVTNGAADILLDNTLFENFDYGMTCLVYSGDISLQATNAVIDGVYYEAALKAHTLNGSIGVQMDGVQVANATTAGDFYAQHVDGTAVIDLTVVGCSFTAVENGVIAISDTIGNVQVSDSTVFGEWYPTTLQGSVAFEIIGNLESEITTAVFDHVTAEGFSTVFNVVVMGNLDLTIDSVVTNSTETIGYFEALNLGQNATMNIAVVNSSFSNTTDGLIFITNILDPDFSLLGTNTFTNIFGQSLSMQADLGDVVLNLEQFVMTNGGGITVSIGFGNIEVNIIDSVLDGSGHGTLLDLMVSSNSLDNGFIILSVENSILSDAENGISTWSEELIVRAMADVAFANMTGTALHFDVRSATSTDRVLSIDLDSVVGTNLGGGMLVYLNDGSLDIGLGGVRLQTSMFGVQVEASSLLAENPSTIDMTVTDCRFDGGWYGLHAMAVNGGSAMITGSQFLGQSGRAYWFDSLYGEMDVEIAESVFDGSEAADMTVYTVEEVENTFEVIGWKNWKWGEDAWSPSTGWEEGALVDLPFPFTYNGVEYPSVYLSSDGYLDFGGGNRIEPVGSTDLIYSSWYDARQFYGYRIAEDNASVMFHWYASEAYFDPDLSMAFQVVLFADGTIQFNYGDMEAYSDDIPYGLMTDGSTIYDLESLYGMPKWEADRMAFLFTPLPLSDGMGVLLTMEEGNINAAITNSTFSSYYGGGVAVLSLNGGLALEVTGSEFSKIYNNEFSALEVYNFNGAAELTMADNTFERIWGLAIHLDLTSTEGGERTIDVSDSVFDKVAYVFYAEIGVDDSSGRTGDDSLNVTVIFRNNVLTDAYGLFCIIGLELNDPVNWTVTVAQMMTNNTMVQENYMGSWPFPENYPEAPALGAIVLIEQRGEDENSVTLEQTATVTGNHIECPGWVGIVVGNEIYNPYGDTTRTFAADITENFVSFTEEFGIAGGIVAASMMTVGTGRVVDDATVTIEDNEVVDGNQNAIAIGALLSVESAYGVGQSCDAQISSLVSVCGNTVEGAYGGVYIEIWYDQTNTVGDWNVTSITHIDGNRLLNVSYAIGAYLDAGVYFGSYYWPPEDEVAVANLVLDYVLTVDDNVVLCSNNMDGGSMIEVDVEHRAEVSISTLCAQANARVTGALSISGNELTELDSDLSGIDLEHGINAEKTASIHADVAVAVEDNVLTVLWEGDGPGPSPYAGIEIDNEIYGWSNNNVITPGPMVMANMTWSVTGNEVTSGFRYGIEVLDLVELEDGLASTAYTVSWDISGNTLTDVKECGVCYEFARNEETGGIIEMAVAVDITENVISLVDGPDNWAGIYLDSCYSTSSWEYWNEQYGNHTFVASVSGNTISGADYGLEIYGTLYFDVPEDYEPAEGEVLYTYVNAIVVEDNYISDCWYGMYLYDAMDVRNNIVECAIGAETYGIYWYEAEGEMVGNTITAEIGVYVDYLHHWLVQGNLVQFGATGIYVYTYDDEEDADGVIINNTITALENPFLPWDSYCIELEETPNVLISGNVLSGADYGVDLDDVWNITISGNDISDCGDSVHIYAAQFVWVEANTMTGSEYGVRVDSGVEDLMIGNNTFIHNHCGIQTETEVHRMTLWNNVFIDNGQGVDISTLYMEAVWYVDDECQASRSDIYFNGSVYILAGGAMLLEDMEMDVDASIPVAEGGLLSMSNVAIDAQGINVQGTIWANLCSFNGADLYLMPGSMGEIRASTFLEAEILIDACDPVIADNLIIASDDYGIMVGNGAAPTIVSNIIAMSTVGIYANGMDMGGIYDNLIVASSNFGLLAENCTGSIHDNVFLLNKVEIMLRNSDVSVEDNEIGFTDLFQVAADYAPLLGLLSSLNVTIPGMMPTADDPLAVLEAALPGTGFDPLTWIKAHTGIWAERSVVETSGNVYGMLNYAVYAVDSEVHFADDIRTSTVTIPWVDITSLGEVVERNENISVHTLNGIKAARSELYVTGSTIEVPDDALVFEASEGWVEGATLLAGGYDYFLFGGSEVYNIATTYEKSKVEDSHSLNEGTWLTITAIDEGEPVANLTIYIRSANGEVVKTVVTDAEGKARVLLPQYAWTFEGKDDGFNPYTINATFESGEASLEVTLNQSYMDVTLEGEEESNIGAVLAVVGVLVILLLIVAAVVVMRRRK